jgi:phosphoribosylaminoimidazole-succinocarboxamide synthase
LFERGTKLADKNGLILVDTKYEFGKLDNTIYLIDEIHTPDSSRYFYKVGYEDRQEHGKEQKQLSKEFVRQWLISQGFQGLQGQKIPLITDDIVYSISDRYLELFESFTGKPLIIDDSEDVLNRIEENINKTLKKA